MYAYTMSVWVKSEVGFALGRIGGRRRRRCAAGRRRLTLSHPSDDKAIGRG